MTSSQELAPLTAVPVGHEGARVDVVERPARAWSGLLGVVVLVASVLLAIGLAFTPVPVLTVVPITVFIVVLCSLVIVPAGTDARHPVLRPLCRHGPAHRPDLGAAADARVAASVSGSGTSRPTSSRSTTPTATRSRSPPSWSGRSPTPSKASYAVDNYLNFVTVQAESALRHVATTHPYDGGGGQHLAARAPPTSSPASSPARSPSASRWRASRSSRCGSATWPTRRRSPRRCCGASRRTPWSRPVLASSRAP